MIPALWVKQQVTIFQVMDVLGVYDGGEEVTRQMLCPVHADNRPSARVYAEDNRVHCYTCGRGWDVFALVMAIKGLNYPQAGEWLIETFALGSSADLPNQLRATLSMPVGSAAPLFQFAETTVREAKPKLTCEQFSKITTALDIVAIQYREHADRERAAKDVGKVLAYLGKVRQ